MKASKRFIQPFSTIVLMMSFYGVAAETTAAAAVNGTASVNSTVTVPDNHAAAGAFDTLIAQGKLKIAVSLQHGSATGSDPSSALSSDTDTDTDTDTGTDTDINAKQRIVANQQITLNIELLSLAPFSQGFTLPYFDLDNSVVVPPSAKTSLNIKTIAGEQWFIQRKQINIYPLTAGRFEIPPLTAKAFINLEHSEVLTGKISSKPFTFTVEQPAAVAENTAYIASPKLSFTLKQSSDEDNKSAAVQGIKQAATYDIGSAVTLTYTLKAEHLHVIMLDKITLPEIKGMQIYQKPAIEKDVFDRFEKFNTAELSQSFTLIFQKEGVFTLPQQRINWWDLQTNTLKEIVIKAQTFKVGKAASQHSTGLNSNDNPSESSKVLTQLLALDKKQLMPWLLISAVLVFIIAIIRRVIAHKQALIASFHRVNKTREKQLSQQFNRHIADKNYQGALNCLYLWVQEASGEVGALSVLIDTANLTRLKTLQQLAYSATDESTQVFTEQDSEALMAGLLSKPKRWQKRQRFEFSLQLNPEK